VINGGTKPARRSECVSELPLLVRSDKSGKWGRDGAHPSKQILLELGAWSFFGIWDFRGGGDLELGIWNFSFVRPQHQRHSVIMAASFLIEPATQLAVFLSNRPGALARVCTELTSAQINIHALAISDTADHSVVRMVVSDPTKALMLLGEHGVLALETDVLMVETDNQPGTLAQIADCLAREEVNIEYAYMAATVNSARGLMILRPDDVDKAQRVLRAL